MESSGSSTHDKVLMTVKEVAKVLRVSEITLRRHMNEGIAPPYFRIGHSIRFDSQAFEAWMASQEKEEGAR